MGTKFNTYEAIADAILEQLEKGTVPWQKPWNRKGGQEFQMPRNFQSKKAYRGINIIILASQSYTCPYWLTYKQAASMGGQVRKGEKSTMIVFWKFLERENEETGKKENIPMLRYYRVFNLEQIDGIDAPAVYNQDDDPYAWMYDVDGGDIVECRRIVDGFKKPPTIDHGGNRACYAPAKDHVQLPQRDQFKSVSEYYSTLFHELGHATGHSSRLKRFGDDHQVAAFGSYDYGREELVAEMTASFLCGIGGVFNSTMKNSAAYLANWIHAIKEDKRMIVIAAGAAQKAADHILGIDRSN